MPQPRNDERNTLVGADLMPNQFEMMHEPIGDFGIWNGQFEIAQALSHPDGVPEGWYKIYTWNDAYATVQTGGWAGANCMRCGSTVAGHSGGVLTSLRYIPVSEDRDYYVGAAMRGSNATVQGGLAVRCYSAAKALTGTVGIGAWAPGVNWVQRQYRIGPAGDAAFPANTRYCQVELRGNTNSETNQYVEFDDVQFQQSKVSYSPQIHLIHDYVNSAVNFTTTVNAWTQDPQSVMTLTTEEPAHIWVWYTINHVNQTRGAIFTHQFRIFCDGVAVPINHFSGSPAANHLLISGISSRLGPVARGAHTIDFRVYVQNNVDSVVVTNRTGFCFYTRQN